MFVASDPIIKMNEITSIGISGMASLNSFHSEGVDVANGGASSPSLFFVILRFFFIVNIVGYPCVGFMKELKVCLACRVNVCRVHIFMSLYCRAQGGSC